MKLEVGSGISLPPTYHCLLPQSPKPDTPPLPSDCKSGELSVQQHSATVRLTSLWLLKKTLMADLPLAVLHAHP